MCVQSKAFESLLSHSNRAVRFASVYSERTISDAWGVALIMLAMEGLLPTSSILRFAVDG